MLGTKRDQSLVYIVDDDVDTRESLQTLFEAAGFSVRTHGNAADFLGSFTHEGPSCLVVDLRLPGMSGAELIQALAELKARIPVLLLTGYADVPTAVQVMKSGALDVIEKGGSPRPLIEAVQRAIDKDRVAWQAADSRAGFRGKVESLTVRERQILELVVAGKTSKTVAAELGISVNTVEVHRANIMKKMAADSLVDLVRTYLSFAGEK